MKVDPRFLTEKGSEVFNGSELLLKGCLEADGGVHLMGGYPGSPTAGFFDSMTRIKDLLVAKGIRAVMNSNEALAAAMLNGSQALACRAVVNMKSVGVHVAADALALGNLAGANTEGGAVVVYGDDPWSDSTQVPADSRYISKHLFIPVIEPANPQEVKDFVDPALKLSARSELYSGFILPTNLADGGGSVRCRPNQYPRLNTNQKIDLETAAIDLNKRVLLPPKTWWQEESLPHRHARAVQIARELGLNRIENPSDERKAIGFVSSGMAHGYLLHALWELGMSEDLPILKLGMTYPLDVELLFRLIEQSERIVVVEERRGFIEEQIAEVLFTARREGAHSGDVELLGKRFPEGLEGIPQTRGLHPSILIDRLVPLFRRVGLSGNSARDPGSILDREAKTIDSTMRVEVGDLPARLPTFCPGCPHRDSASLCLEIKKRFMDADYMRRKYDRDPVDLVFHGGCGCYTMLMFPPNTDLMHDYSGMGLGGGSGVGTDAFTTNKEAVFMGDGTFFHSGLLAISQAVKLKQDITFIILDNSTTAMTGHQPTPGVDYDIIGSPTAVQDIEEIASALAGDSDLTVVRVDPEKRDAYRQLLERTFLSDGVKVIIADKECAITRGRRKRREEHAIRRRLGYLPTWEHMNVNTEICSFCLTCAEFSGCPGLKHVSSDYGPKVDTDITWCVNDGACERIGACSAFERVIIKRKRAAKSRVPELNLGEIPEPQKGLTGDLWRCCLTGVGGMGLGVATSILVRAGHKEGYHVLFLDKKGLAIRNGGTVSQVAYLMGDQPVTALIPYGKADLLIGIDVLEAARALDPNGRTRIATKQRTAAVVNTDKISTIAALMGRENFDPEKLEELIRQHTRSDEYLARNISRICEKYLGSKLYSNIMMLGFAFQKGLIPVSMHSMAWAIKETISTDFRKNLYAFNMGRKLVVDPDLFRGAPVRTGWQETLEERTRHTIRRHAGRRKLADELQKLAVETIGSLTGLDEKTKRDVVIRIYDCVRWGGIDHAKRYVKGVLEIHKRDHQRFEYAATKAVIFNLADAMLIKDGIFLAELSTSPEKHARDREKYNVNPANGDRICYRHLWHWEIRIGPRSLHCGITVYHWMLYLLREFRWVRKVLPLWKRKEKRYLRTYEQNIAEFRYDSPSEYYRAVRALESGQCMDCINPRCEEAGCPLGGEISQWVQSAYQNRWKEAADKLLETNNFPEFTSQICPAPCQDACKQRLRGYPVQIKAIESEIIDRAFEQGWITPQPAGAKTRRRIAIVGSGPAGLTCAQQLARSGHDVVIFEKDPKPGGLLRYGIPDFRLEKALVDRRIRQLEQEGISFRTGIEVARDVSGAILREEFDAVCLATGARRPVDLDVPGRKQGQIYLAMDLLRQENLRAAGEPGAQGSPINAVGKIAVVIGGGETGDDCVDTLCLQGAKEVHQLEILPEASTPPDRDRQALDLTVPVHRRWNVKTLSFSGDDGQVSQLNAVVVDWTNFPRDPKMREIPGSAFKMKTDMVILATGFRPTVSRDLADQLALATDETGRPIVHDYRASEEGVFVTGDLVTGPSYVVNAINSGRRSAEKINQYLARTPVGSSLARVS